MMSIRKIVLISFLVLGAVSFRESQLYLQGYKWFDDNISDVVASASKTTTEAVSDSSQTTTSESLSARSYVKLYKNQVDGIYPRLNLAILFIHFHKSGGTEACSNMMVRMQKSLQVTHADFSPRKKRDNNCNAKGAGPNIDERRSDPNATLTCKNFIEYTTNRAGQPYKRNNFVAVEVPLDHEFVCPEFRTFGLIRDPVSRSLSHIKVRHWTADFVKGVLNSTKKPSVVAGKRIGYIPVQQVYPSLNNMVIRQLLGRNRMLDIDRPIDKQDLKQAQLIVDQMDLMVPTEHQLHPLVLQLLRERVPEYYEGVTNRYKETLKELDGGVPAPRNSSYTPDPVLLKLLQEHNKFDTELYNYVVQKIGIDTYKGK